MEIQKVNNEVKKLRRFLTSRTILILVTLVILFNLFSTKILPSNLFTVYASNIDTNQLVNLTNSERTSRDLNALTIDSRLVQAAYAKGQDMLEKDYWAHYGPNGESPWDFILSSGYDYVYAGENLAKDFTTAATVHSAWMASPSHKANIINSKYSNIGIAAVTGEFQGSETTIVVQMFGSLEVKTEEPVIAIEDVLPETIEEEVEQEVDVTLEPPEITSPNDGEILNDGIFDVRGKAEGANKVYIFDQDKQKGKAVVDDSKFIYTNGKAFSEGKHKIYARSEQVDNSLSEKSNTVSVTIDSISPNIVENSATFDYEEVGEDSREFIVSVSIEDNPVIVEGVYEDKKLLFIEDEGTWRGSFVEEDINAFSDLEISAEDLAGNRDEVVIKKERLISLAQNFEELNTFDMKVRSWFVEDILGRVFTRSLRGQINLIITVFMIVLLSAERIMLARTGLTKVNSSSLFHIPVFSVLLFVSLIGGGGEIL